ncbi:MAG: biofilm PGA synthesis protein PgaC [Planctomycetales bacterium]|nr:biofilm PGA synthesis protein PgaC [Planctomycetales bacterium]
MLRRFQTLFVAKICLVAASVALPVVACDAAEPIRVAIYADAGSSLEGSPNVKRCLSNEAGFMTEIVTAAQIRAGKLKDFDVVVFPGGSGSKQGGTLGEEGRAVVKKFVEDGRGYLGICAGAYLASADYSWSLHLLDAKVLDRKHWARGKGDVELSLTADARKFLKAEADAVTVRYAQGPLLAPADKADIPDYETLATYKTEIAKNGAPSGVMLGTTAAARGEFGKGRVFCYSPHPEAYGNLDHYIQAAVRWAAKK